MLGGDAVDASLLTLPLYGYVRGDDERMRKTLQHLRARLSEGALVHRYDRERVDAGRAGDGAFGIAGFWGVECRALGGDLPGAVADFESLLGYANDLGLYGEQIDPATREQLGNFPQAFTHVGLVNAALTLEAIESGASASAGAPDRTGEKL